jgi:hypothetical protein
LGDDDDQMMQRLADNVEEMQAGNGVRQAFVACGQPVEAGT